MADREVDFTGDEFNSCFLDLLKLVITKSHDFRAKDLVSAAILCFLTRIANTWHSIWTLQRHSPEPTMFLLDAGALLRAMLDASYQAEYVVHDADKRESRATDYLDYEHVERHKRSTKVLRHDNQLAHRLKSSPKPRPRREEGA